MGLKAMRLVCPQAEIERLTLLDVQFAPATAPVANMGPVRLACIRTRILG